MNRSTLRRAAGWTVERTRLLDAVWRVAEPATRSRVARSILPAQLHDLMTSAAVFSEDVRDVLGFVGASLGDDGPRAAVSSAIAQRSATQALRYPTTFDVAERTERLLFHLVTSLRPRIVVETGVGNGRSTAIILAAMDHIGSGHLHSVDISDLAGSLAPAHHPRWTFHVTDGSARAVDELCTTLPHLDLFLHDSNHSYRTQSAEYAIALRHLVPGGLLASDDVNWSYAFADAAATAAIDFAVLVDLGKCFGVVRQPPARPV